MKSEQCFVTLSKLWNHHHGDKVKYASGIHDGIRYVRENKGDLLFIIITLWCKVEKSILNLCDLDLNDLKPHPVKGSMHGSYISGLQKFLNLNCSKTHPPPPNTKWIQNSQTQCITLICLIYAFNIFLLMKNITDNVN